MLIPAHPCAQLPLTMMSRTYHCEAQYHKKFFRSKKIEETCGRILGRDFKITAGLRVKLSDAGREYLTIWDREKGTNYYDEGVGTVVASGRYAYLGLCDVKWDSGNKPEVDNTYYVYNCGNDGLYHLALVDEPKWELPVVEERAVSEKERQTLEILREQRGANVASNHRCTGPAFEDANQHDYGFPQSCKSIGTKHLHDKSCLHCKSEGKNETPGTA